ncbi:hypothetical protein DOY81_004883, partial [Sarcophaga bullata]
RNRINRKERDFSFLNLNNGGDLYSKARKHLPKLQTLLNLMKFVLLLVTSLANTDDSEPRKSTGCGE